MTDSGNHLPSASQVRALRRICVVKSLKEVKAYFGDQISKDTTWQAWGMIKGTIDNWLDNQTKEIILFGLELLADLILTKNNGKE